MGTGAQLAMLPWFVRDYITATRHLSLAERGAYTDLLFFQWENGRLPVEPERLARLVGCSTEQFSEVWPAIQGKFAAAADGSLFNRRLEDHRAKAVELSQKRATAGKAGGKQSAKHRATNGKPIAPDLFAGVPPAIVNSPSPSPSPSPDPSSSPYPSSNTETSAELDVGCGQGAEIGAAKRSARVRPPYEAKEFHHGVIDLYQEILSELPRVKLEFWDGDRAKALTKRIREACTKGRAADTLKWWRGFFEVAATNDHWCGRNPGSDWKANLDWFLVKRNFLKVIEWEPPTRRGNGARDGR